MAVKKPRVADDRRMCSAMLFEEKRRELRIFKSGVSPLLTDSKTSASSGCRRQSMSHDMRSRHHRTEPASSLIASNTANN